MTTGPGKTRRTGAAGNRGTGSLPRVPGGTRRPGAARPARPKAAAPQAPAPRRRPRLTGRAAVLAVVLALLAVSYASSMRAYLQQRSHINELQSEIAQRRTDIKALQREQARWQDPAFVKEQARLDFGYLMPGQKSFVVLGADGKPLHADSTLPDPAAVLKTQPVGWWNKVWGSNETAGHPPAAKPAPATRIQ